MKDVLVYDPKKRQKVLAGQYDEASGSFHKSCTEAHYMKIRAGFGISCEVINELNNMNCLWIYIHFGKEIKRIPFQVWASRKSEKFGHDYQKFMEWNKMNTVESKQIDFIGELS